DARGPWLRPRRNRGDLDMADRPADRAKAGGNVAMRAFNMETVEKDLQPVMADIADHAHGKIETVQKIAWHGRRRDRFDENGQIRTAQRVTQHVEKLGVVPLASRLA